MIEHLTPTLWAQANRSLVAKAIGEFAHERLISPRDGYVVEAESDWRFDARRLALDHWAIDPASLSRVRDGRELPVDALDLIVELREPLELEGEQLGLYLEEITSTLSALAYKLAEPVDASELAGADFQTIEVRLTEGHPCFVANSGRLGFDAADYQRYAPEAANATRLLWVAAHRDLTHASGDYAAVVERDGLDDRLREQGLDPADYLLIPVHPWQWQSRLAVTFAADVAERRLVCLGPGDDDYLPQQSIRTFFNTTDPSRDYVKTALSVVNMGFVRGLSATYMAGTPAINDWVAELVASDAELAGFGILRERAAVGYRPRRFEGDPYSKMLAALWRESPLPRLAPGERLATMASLLHVDRDGRSFSAALIERSGLAPEAWLRRYLDAYLRPLLHCFYAYDLVFMPHGENLILVLDDDVPVRVFLKDIAEEVVLMDGERELPEEVERIRAEVPEDMKVLSILTDVVDCFLRFLNAILVTDGTLGEDGIWPAVAACARDYQREHPELAERFERHDLFAGEFALSCLNRLQLRNSRQMVDLQDPAGSLQLVGTLANPLAPLRHT